jgi:hypothetical protein
MLKKTYEYISYINKIIKEIKIINYMFLLEIADLVNSLFDN